MSQSFDNYYPGIYADAYECMSEPEDFVETTEYAKADRLQSAINSVDEAQQETEEAWADEVDPNEEDEGMPSALRWLHENSNQGIAEITRSRTQNDKEYEGPEVEHEGPDSVFIDGRKIIGVLRGNRIVHPAVASYLDDNDDEDIDVDAIAQEYYRTHPQNEGFIDSEDEEIDEEIQEEMAAEERRNHEEMMVKVNNLLNKQ